MQILVKRCRWANNHLVIVYVEKKDHGLSGSYNVFIKLKLTIDQRQKMLRDGVAVKHL